MGWNHDGKDKKKEQIMRTEEGKGKIYAENLNTKKIRQMC